MAITQKCFIEVFKNTLKSNETRFKLVWRVAKPNGALWRVTWDTREYVCRYENNLTVDPKTGEQVGIFSQNGEEVVLVYRIPQADKDYYAPEKIAQRAQEADEALEYLAQSKAESDNGHKLAETLEPGDVVTFLNTELNIDTFKYDDLGEAEGIYQGLHEFGLGINVLVNGKTKLVVWGNIRAVATALQPFKIGDIVEPTIKTDWQYGQVTACYELDGMPGEWRVDIHKMYYAAPGKLARTSETCLSSVRKLLATWTVQLHVETPAESKALEKAGREMAEKAETGDVVTFVEYGQECQGTYQGLDRGNMGIRVMYKNNPLGIFFEDIRAISHQTPDQPATQVDQTPNLTDLVQTYKDLRDGIDRSTSKQHLARKIACEYVVCDLTFSLDPVKALERRIKILKHLRPMTQLEQECDRLKLDIYEEALADLLLVLNGPDQQTPACFDRHGHQVDQTETPDPDTTQEQADALVDQLDMTSFVEEYEYNHLGHVYSLQDGSSIVVTSPSVYRWEV